MEEATQTQEATSQPEVVDPWEEAEAEFESLGGEPKEVKKEEKAPESHIESEVPEYLKLDGLRVPHKYKPFVEEHLKKVASEFEAKQQAEFEAKQQELGQHKEVVLGLVNVFKDIAQTPKEQVAQKLADYIERYGQNLGLDPATAKAFRESKQAEAQAVQAQLTIEAINQKYRERLAQTQDPNEFLNLMQQSDIEKTQLVENQVLGKVGQLLKAYHEKYIAPDKETLNEFKTRAQKDAEEAVFNSTRSSWNDATESLKSKLKEQGFDDFEKYKPQILKLAKENKAFSAARAILNEDPSDVDGRVEFLESIYLKLANKDHIERLKLPKQSGLPPSQKHINTNKKGGGNWKDAEAHYLSYPEG